MKYMIYFRMWHTFRLTIRVCRKLPIGQSDAEATCCGCYDENSPRPATKPTRFILKTNAVIYTQGIHTFVPVDRTNARPDIRWEKTFVRPTPDQRHKYSDLDTGQSHQSYSRTPKTILIC